MTLLVAEPDVAEGERYDDEFGYDVAPVPTFTRGEVAELSNSDIALASDEELVACVRAGQPFDRADTVGRLEYLDRPLLERLAFLSRRCCRNLGY